MALYEVRDPTPEPGQFDSAIVIAKSAADARDWAWNHHVRSRTVRARLKVSRVSSVAKGVPEPLSVYYDEREA